MDPLTHTLVGASAAATRPASRVPLATPALLVGANLPDVDAVLYLVGASDLALLIRRGWTHGLPAMAVLPWLVLAAMLAAARLLGLPRPPVRRLAALCCLAVWSHPCLDWLNTYGMRWLAPVDGSWSYGDSVFIMDPWLWIVLGGGVLLGRRPTLPLAAGWAIFAGGLALAVGARAPHRLPVVAAVALVLLAALLVRPRAGWRHRAAVAGLALGAAWVILLIGLHAVTVQRVRAEFAARGVAPVEALMVGPAPIDPRLWDVVAVTPDRYRFGSYSWRRGSLDLATRSIPRPDGAIWEAVRRDPAVRGFVRWARFPWIESEPAPGGLRVFLMDARYARRRTEGFGGAVVELAGEPAAGSQYRQLVRSAPAGADASIRRRIFGR